METKNKVKNFNDYLEDYVQVEVKVTKLSKKKHADIYIIQQGTIPSYLGTTNQRKFMRELANPVIY